MRERLLSGVGVLAMLGVAWALAPAGLRRRADRRTVGWGMAVLFGFALLVLRTPAAGVFGAASRGVDALLDFTREGSRFVFGRLATDTSTFGFVLAFQVLPTIVFFSALTSVLYHTGVLPFVIDRMARALARTLRVSGAESFSTVADIFVGQTEAPLAVRPYLPAMTLSELHACMVAGFATTAGGVLAAYVAMLRDHVPGVAGHLIACSVMSAPASLVIAKLMLPETEVAPTAGGARVSVERSHANLLDAIASGTTEGVKLAVNVGAMLIVFLALTALVDAGLGALGRAVGVELGLSRVFAWVFWPLAAVMGVPAEDVPKLASLLGQKTVLNEFVAYTTMSQELARDPGWLTERGRLVASYALCGFANFGSIGIQIGGYSALAPERRGDVSRLALRAMAGGLLTTCLVACVAGLVL
ncbi:MAG: NupC/NupG family nucleoside CNT transporter [Polyangiaceae bacterium]|nr:NupC/NupG family nucleoside CNT transporter [Polyangiaceae bacterium]